MSLAHLSQLTALNANFIGIPSELALGSQATRAVPNVLQLLSYLTGAAPC